MVHHRRPRYDVVMPRLAPAAVALSLMAVVVTALILITRSPDRTPTAPDVAEPPIPRAPAAPPSPDTFPGLRCIRGGTTREEVRRIMGEPDSIAFGDWIYGRSSITFGYGVVLDYASPDGRLVVCP